MRIEPVRDVCLHRCALVSERTNVLAPGIALPKISAPMRNSMREKILATIRAIPRGTVSSYGAIARAAGYPGAARQVVAALHKAFDLPWHRVLGAGGEIKLRGDFAVEQRLRLESEGVAFRGRRVDMKRHEFHFRTSSRKNSSRSRKPKKTRARTRSRRRSP
jgi:methylated-DNA-protein-cysteine methyltransferase related protein